MFCVPLHFTGTFFSMLVPSPRGPRQPGQFSAEAVSERTDISGIAKYIKIIIFWPVILPTPEIRVFYTESSAEKYLFAFSLLD
jgi:hypothetical protein